MKLPIATASLAFRTMMTCSICARRRCWSGCHVNEGLQVDDRLPVNRRYCRPWTAQFLATLARAHYARFHTPLQVNSAVRTVEFQQHLMHINGNAAPAEGDTASPHLTGQAVDIAKHGLSLAEIAWLRGYLLPLVQEGKIDVEEEFQQSCFHISVYKKYLPPAPERDLAVCSPRRNFRFGCGSALRPCGSIKRLRGSRFANSRTLNPPHAYYGYRPHRTPQTFHASRYTCAKLSSIRV